MAKIAAKRYGDALFEVAKESGTLERLFEEAKMIMVILEENPEIVECMRHPKVTTAEKRTVLEDLFGEDFSSEMVELLVMLTEKDHSEEMRNVLQHFIEKVKEENGIGSATVTTAIELSQEKKIAVENRLLETTKYKKLEIQFWVDTSIIGGMIIRIGDRVVDSSIRTKLENIVHELR